jgi:hypothetical protein
MSSQPYDDPKDYQGINLLKEFRSWSAKSPSAPDILVTFKSVCTIVSIVNNLFCSIFDHAGLLKRISIGFIAGGLIFKGLSNYLPIITRYSAVASRHKPLKIRPLPALGGISFEISSFEDSHDLISINESHTLLNVTDILIHFRIWIFSGHRYGR